MNMLVVFMADKLAYLSVAIFIIWLWRLAQEKRAKILSFALYLLPLVYMLGLTARTLYYNPRPFVTGGFRPLIDHVADNGFPSDHVLLLASLASLVFCFDKKFSIPLWIIALAVGFSRLYAGIHHFVDIMGSLGIALIATGLVYFVFQRQKKL